jgi:hypothetical protein
MRSLAALVLVGTAVVYGLEWQTKPRFSHRYAEAIRLA